MTEANTGQALGGGWDGHEEELKDLYWEMMTACAQSTPHLLKHYVQVLVEKGLATPEEAERMRQEALQLAGNQPGTMGQ